MNDENALFSAAAESDLAMIEYLIEEGFDVNKRDTNGETALFYAASAEAINCLLDWGANCNIRNHHGNTVLFSIMPYDCPEATAALCNKVDDINDVGLLGFTALHNAAIYGNIEGVKILCSHGADHTITSWNIGDPFETALRNNNIKVAKYLYERGKIDINRKDNEGQTILHGLVRYHNLRWSSLYFLCKLGINIYHENNDGLRASDSEFYEYSFCKIENYQVAVPPLRTKCLNVIYYHQIPYDHLPPILLKFPNLELKNKTPLTYSEFCSLIKE